MFPVRLRPETAAVQPAADHHALEPGTAGHEGRRVVRQGSAADSQLEARHCVVRPERQRVRSPPPDRDANGHADVYGHVHLGEQIGEIAKGGQLRVAFPTFAGETPGSQYTAPACGTNGTLNATICASLGSSAAQANWSVPDLQAGQSTLASGDPGLLASYQYLAGDAPTLLNGSGWTWKGINGATVLAANVISEANQQNDVFYSGIFLGVAAAAAIAFITELLRPVWRKDLS